MDIQVLERIAMMIGYAVGVVCAVLTTLTVIEVGKHIATCFRSWIMMKIKSYHEGQMVIVNGRKAEIMRIGFFSVLFRLQNGNGEVHVMPITTARMDFNEVVRVYDVPPSWNSDTREERNAPESTERHGNDLA